ncbi:MAG: hypothetical protein ACI9EF_002790, partial [Pseudohongiellaceae bacterium]
DDDDLPSAHLLVSGRWDRQTGALTMEPLLEVLANKGSRAALPEQADIVLRGLVNGNVVSEFALSARSSGDDGGCATADADKDSDLPVSPVTHFSVLIPARGLNGQAIESLSVVGTAAQPLTTLTLIASDNAPVVTALSPGVDAITGQHVQLSWEASDVDGDELHTTVRYVPNGGDQIVPLVTHSTGNTLAVDLAGLPHFVSGQGYFELLVSDGFHTTRARTATLNGPGAYAAAGGAAPFVEIYHPDDQKSFRKSSGVILHSSGWDLEDDALTGSSIQWDSDVDGNIGSGRRFITSELSVGVHQITVTATDSGGQPTTRTHTVTITDRDLPDLSGDVCAIDLGFGGPGNASVTLCGEDLTTGGSADLELVGAPASTTAFMILGLINGPVSLKGGTLVPFPWVSLSSLPTNAQGEISIPNVTGSGSAFTAFLQFVIVDGSQQQGFGFSNALQVEF